MKIIFVFVSAVTGFFVGLWFGIVTLPAGTGLEGPAAILFNGIVGALLVVIISFFVMNRIEPKRLRKIVIILALLNLLPIIWLLFRFMQIENKNEQQTPPDLIPTEIRLSSLTLINKKIKKAGEEQLGIGMVKPDFFSRNKLYFYQLPLFDKTHADQTPIDSLVFAQTEHHHYDINYAPPWFYPEHLKLDYDILYLKAISLSREWVEVEVNRESNLTAWILSADSKLLFWNEFLLQVHSVKPKDPVRNFLRIKPLKNASPVQALNYSILVPVMIRESWLKVDLLDENYKKVGSGWLLWKADGKLQVNYYLLS